jgi:hypothetical protein
MYNIHTSYLYELVIEYVCKNVLQMCLIARMHDVDKLEVQYTSKEWECT